MYTVYNPRSSVSFCLTHLSPRVVSMESFDTETRGRGVDLPQTDWTRIGNPLLRAAVLRELCEKYWKPLYAYLRCRGFSNDLAKDLVQGFFTDKILGREFLDKADRSRGRFRSFLLVAIRNYAASVRAKDNWTCIIDYDVTAEHGTDAEAEFVRVWAEDVLEGVLRELEDECRLRGKNTHWKVFREWLVECRTEEHRDRMANLCARYGVPDEATAYNMVSNLKKRFRVILRRHLIDQAGCEEDPDEEIRAFIAVFSKPAARLRV